MNSCCVGKAVESDDTRRIRVPVDLIGLKVPVSVDCMAGESEGMSEKRG